MTRDEIEAACALAAQAGNLVFIGLVVPAGEDGYSCRLQNKEKTYAGCLSIETDITLPQLHADLAELVGSMQRGAKLQDRINRSKVKREFVRKDEHGDWWRFDRKSFELLENGGRFGRQEVVAVDREKMLVALR